MRSSCRSRAYRAPIYTTLPPSSFCPSLRKRAPAWSSDGRSAQVWLSRKTSAPSGTRRLHSWFNLSLLESSKSTRQGLSQLFQHFHFWAIRKTLALPPLPSFLLLRLRGPSGAARQAWLDLLPDCPISHLIQCFGVETLKQRLLLLGF